MVASSWGDESGKVWVFQVGLEEGSGGDKSDKVWVFQVGLKGDTGGRRIYEHSCWVLVPRLRQDIIQVPIFTIYFLRFS